MVSAKPITKAAGVTFGCFRGGVEGFRQFLLRGKVSGTFADYIWRSFLNSLLQSVGLRLAYLPAGIVLRPFASAVAPAKCAGATI